MRWFEIIREGRLDFLSTQYNNKIKAKADADPYASYSPSINVFADMDPTKTKIYTQWLINLFLANKLDMDDQDKIAHDLRIYDAKKSLMPNKDINQIKSVEQLDNIVKQYSNAETKNELDRKERESLKKQIKVVYKGPEGQIVQPLDRDAMMFLGRGTMWCVSMRGDTGQKYYDDYFGSNADVYIIILANGEKYCYESTQLADAQMKMPTNIDNLQWAFEKILPQHRDSQLALLRKDPNYFPFFYHYDDPEYIDICLKSGKGDNLALSFMPSITPQQRLDALAKNGQLIDRFSDPTDEEIKVAQKTYKWAVLQLKHPDIPFMAKAVQENSRLLEHLEKKFPGITAKIKSYLGNVSK